VEPVRRERLGAGDQAGAAEDDEYGVLENQQPLLELGRLADATHGRPRHGREDGQAEQLLLAQRPAHPLSLRPTIMSP
jgi:hypothetical protein